MERFDIDHVLSFPVQITPSQLAMGLSGQGLVLNRDGEVDLLRGTASSGAGCDHLHG